MTGSNDLERLLGAYLEDGPRRAPDRPVDAAIAFARSNPRRRDPLLFLKPDVMGRRPAAFSPQLGWALLVLALTIGVVAAVAIGSRPDQVPVVPPPVVESASPSVPASPDPSVGPSPSPAPTSFGVDLSDEAGFTRTLEVLDASGTVLAVEEGPVPLDEPVADIVATVDPVDPARVLVRWPFKPCDEELVLTIDQAAERLVLERRGCVIGDTIGGNDHQITLTFAGPVDVAALDVQLTEVP